MPRRTTQFCKGSLYHVTNRGALKSPIFDDPILCNTFLALLEIYAAKCNISIVAYCVMPNHFHLLIRQDGDTTISDFMKKLCRSYSCAFNKTFEKTGAVFQGRFWCDAVMDHSYLYTVICYIHLNPIKAKLCSHPGHWKYSNYHEFVGAEPNRITDKDAVSTVFGDLTLYQEMLRGGLKRLRSS